MNVLIAVLTLLLLAIVVVIVSGPLRRAGHVDHAASRAPGSADDGDGEARGQRPPAPEELAAAREAKYREIRDAELDYRTGKLSREDYAAIDAELRTEALEILNRIERAAAAQEGGEAGSVRPRDA